MRFSASVALPLLLSSVTAFVIPKGQPDGVYLARVDGSGNEIHERLSDAPEISAREANPLERRAAQAWCGCGIILNNGDTDVANRNLANRLQRGTNIGAHQSLYSVAGSAVAFACNYSGGSKVFSGDVIGQNNAKITAACGRYTAGSWGEGGSWATGYMRSGENGGNFCGVALSSPAHRC